MTRPHLNRQTLFGFGIIRHTNIDNFTEYLVFTR
jgi:hypothetical protein